MLATQAARSILFTWLQIAGLLLFRPAGIGNELLAASAGSGVALSRGGRLGYLSEAAEGGASDGGSWMKEQHWSGGQGRSMSLGVEMIRP